MEGKWTFVSGIMYAGHNVGVWIKAKRNTEDPAKFIFETKAEEMTQEEITKASKEHGIHYMFKPE